jgi:hypothetical protein
MLDKTSLKIYARTGAEKIKNLLSLKKLKIN